METLPLYLSPIDNVRFKAIVTKSLYGDGETESSLPFDGRADRRTSLLKALEMVSFQPEDFQCEGELDWMVQVGMLFARKDAFHPNMYANIGKVLYHALFPEGSKVKGLLQQAINSAESKGTPLHLQIMIEADAVKRSELSDYPWELLHDGRSFLAMRHVSFSRYIAYVAPPPNLPSVEQVNVLLVSSTAFDPNNGLEKLSKQEQQAVRSGLDKAKQEGCIRLEEPKYATFNELRTYLTEHRGKNAPHVIHFDGHGLFGKRCKQCRTTHQGLLANNCRQCGIQLPDPEGYLVFEDDNGRADYVSAEELGNLIHQAALNDRPDQQLGVVLIVLSACQSGLSFGRVFNGVAQNLISHGIPAVVAMQFSVSVFGAAAFAEQFYRSLGQREPLVMAVSKGREAMGSEYNQWYRPVLYLRWKDNEGGQIFATPKQDAKFLFSIQFELKKGVEKKGKFFRKEGPLWIDFEEGYVVKRDEVEKIIDCFKAGWDQILLVGSAASGKSVIARNVGFELANKYGVFYISTKMFETHKIDAIFNDILKLKSDSHVIIEDAHLYPDYCDALIKNIVANKTKVKVLFTTRPTYDLHRDLSYLGKCNNSTDRLEESNSIKKSDSTEKYKCKKFTLEAFNPAYAIIKKYSEKNNLVKPSFEEIGKIISQSKESLWVLAYFLTAWEPGKPIEKKQVYEKIYNDLTGMDSKYGVQGSQYVILALAPFYKYEIKVSKLFITHALKQDKGTITKLIEMGEIKEDDGFLSLHHSEHAEIYLDVGKMHPDLVDELLYKLRKIDKNFTEENYVNNMFLYYLREEPGNYDEVFSQLQNEKHLVRNIIDDEKAYNAICDLIVKDTDGKKIGRCLCVILLESREAGGELINIVKSKIEKESDIEKIVQLVSDISYTCSSAGKTLFETVKLKINKESDIEKIGHCVRIISEAFDYDYKRLEENDNYDYIGLTKLEFLDLHDLKSKIEEESNIEKIGRCVRDIRNACFSDGMDLINSLDPKNLKLKLEEEPSIEKIGRCVGNIGGQYGTELVESIFDNLKSKNEKEPDIQKIAYCFKGILTVSREMETKLVESLDPTAIKFKIEKEPDIEKIIHFISYIATENKEYGILLVESFDPIKLKLKIEAENDIEKIGDIIKIILYASKNVGITLVENLDLSIFKSKTEKESNLKKIGRFINEVSFVNNEIGKGLVESINPEKFKSKIRDESNLEKIAHFLSDILSTSSEIDKALIEEFKKKIDDEIEIEKIRYFINYISNIRKEVGRMLVESLDHKSLKSKIEIESDIEKILKFIKDILSMSNEKGTILVESLDLNKLKQKIKKESNLEKNVEFVVNFSSANKEIENVLIDAIKTEIEKESDIEKIEKYILAIKNKSKVVGSELVESLNLNYLKLIIEKESEMGKILPFISVILHTNRRFGTALLESLDIDKLNTIIKKESNLEIIMMFLFDILYLSKDIEKLIIDDIKMKIKDESNIGRIGRFVRDIYSESRNVGDDLVGSLDIMSIKSKIDKESDLEKIGQFILNISFVSPMVGTALVESLDLTNLKSKIEKDADVGEIEKCICDIQVESSKVGEELMKCFSKISKAGNKNEEKNFDFISMPGDFAH